MLLRHHRAAAGEAFRLRQHVGPGQPPVTAVQHRHAANVAWHGGRPVAVAKPACRRRSDEVQHFCPGRLGIMDQAGAAAAQRGDRRHGDREGEIEADGRIRRRAAAGQHVLGGDNR